MRGISIAAALLCHAVAASSTEATRRGSVLGKRSAEERDEPWRARIESDRVVGHVDHPHWIDLHSMSFHVGGDDLVGLMQDPEFTGLTEGPEEESHRDRRGKFYEFIVKLAAPVQSKTSKTMHAILREATAAHPAKQVWHAHAAKNTILIHAPFAVALKLHRLHRVVWVGRMNDVAAPHFKLHHTITESARAPQRDSVDTGSLDILLHGRGLGTTDETPDGADGTEEADEWAPPAQSDLLRGKIRAFFAGRMRLNVSIDFADSVVRVSPQGSVGGVGGARWRAHEAALRQAAEVMVRESGGFAGHIHSIEHPTLHRSTNKYSREVMSTGGYNTTLSKAQREPFQFLSGKGHIVGVADSGVDHDHCFFHDPDHETPIGYTNEDHRKIVYYKPAGGNLPGATGDVDPKAGHGTHVAGTIAGSVHAAAAKQYPEMVEYHGFVPESKLVVFDMSAGNDAESVWPPSNIKTSLFEFASRRGARVHSNSWGSNGAATYGKNSRLTDEFIHNSKTDMVLFSAGNEADKACRSSATNPLCDKRTIMTPATAKNAVCVGASMAPLESWEEYGLSNYYLQVRTEGSAADPSHNFTLVKASFGERHPVLEDRVEMVLAEPITACNGQHEDQSKLDNAEAIKGKIALVDRGVCFFAVKVLALAQAGAKGVLVINHTPGDAIVMGQDGIKGFEEQLVPAWMISLSDGKRLKELLKATPKALASVTTDHRFNSHKNMHDMSEFSSRGPTSDLRFKPDVVAIGYYVHSARSDSLLTTYNCDLAAEMGTSMAAPEVSALAVQMAEYLQKHHEPKVVQPSGALMKAMLIQSAVPLTGIVDRNAQGDWEALRPRASPSFYQGHGRVNLASILTPEGQDKRRIQLGVFDHDNIEEEMVHCVAYNGLSPHGFRATLVWSDKAGSATAMHTLINDLDLEVTTPEGVTYFGNSHGDPKSQMYDRLNPAEKVTIPGALEGSYLVKVKKFSVPADGAQPFALVVSGVKAGDALSCRDPCTGPACGVGPHVNLPYQEEVSMKVWDWKVYSFVSDGHVSTIQFSFAKKAGFPKDADVNMFIRADYPPTLTEFDVTYDGKQCRDTACWNNDGKTLSHRPTGDKAGRVYYMALHAGCCHEAEISVEMTSDAQHSVTPLVSSLGVAGTASSNHLRLSFQQAYDGVKILIKGENFGTDVKAVNVVFAGDTKEETDSNLLVCNVGSVSPTLIACTTEPSSGNVTDAVLVLNVGGNVIVATGQTISFAPAPANRYRAVGLRSTPCEKVDTCGVNTDRIHFNYFISTHGDGDVFIVGDNIGEKIPGGDAPAATVIYRPVVVDPFGKGATALANDAGGRGGGGGGTLRSSFRCQTDRYVSNSVLHCTTEEGSVGDTMMLTISIFGVEVDVLGVLSFAMPSEVTGLSLRGINPGARLVLSYTLAQSPFVLHGTELGDRQFLGQYAEGRTSRYSLPEADLNITYGVCPSGVGGAVEVEIRQASGISVVLSDPPVTKPICFQVSMYGLVRVSTPETGVLYILGKPVAQGLALSLLGAASAELKVPFSGKTGSIYVKGENLGIVEDAATIVFLGDSDAEVGACRGTFLSESCLQCDLPATLPTGTTLHLQIVVGSIELDQSFTLTIAEPPRVEGISTSPPMDGASWPSDATLTLSESKKGSAIVYLSGVLAEDPFVYFGKHTKKHGCSVKPDLVDGASAGTTLACLLDPHTPAGDYQLAAFFGGTQAQGIVTLAVKIDESDPPAALVPLVVTPSQAAVFAGVPLTLSTAQPAQPNKLALTRGPCSATELLLYRGGDLSGTVWGDVFAMPSDHTFAIPLPTDQAIKQRGSASASHLLEPFMVCFAAEGDFWHPVDGELTLPVVAVTALTLLENARETIADTPQVPVTVWRHDFRDDVVDRVDVALGDFPPTGVVILRVSGEGLPTGSDTHELAITTLKCNEITETTDASKVLAAQQEARGSSLTQAYTLVHPSLRVAGSSDPNWNMCFVLTENNKVTAAAPLGKIAITACFPTEGTQFEGAGLQECGSRGKCSAEGACVCDKGFRGRQCEIVCPTGRSLTNLTSTELHVCSDVGTCTASGVCECAANYYSHNCAFRAKELGVIDESAALPLKRTEELVHGTSDWHLYHIAGADAPAGRPSTHQGVYIHLSWSHVGSLFDILVWNESDSIGIPAKAAHSYVMTPADEEKVIVFLNKTVSEEVFIGLYGSCPNAVTVPYVLVISWTMSEGVETPQPLMSALEDFSGKYEALTRAAGFLLGILVLCLCLTMCRIFVSPLISMFTQKMPHQLDDVSDLVSETSFGGEMTDIVNDPVEGGQGQLPMES